jgi:hypothetical protein
VSVRSSTGSAKREINVDNIFKYKLRKWDLKFCDDDTLIQILCSLALSIIQFLFKTQRFGDRIMSRSSGKTYSAGPNRYS